MLCARYEIKFGSSIDPWKETRTRSLGRDAEASRGERAMPNEAADSDDGSSLRIPIEDY